MQSQKENRWRLETAVWVDGFTLLAGVLLLPTAVARFATFSAANAIWLTVAYALFCLGVLWLKRLVPQPDADTVPLPDWVMRQNTLRLLGVVFALFLTTIVAIQLGYFDAIFEVDVRELGSGESSALLVFGPGAWLGGALFYMLILGSTAPPNMAVGSPRARQRSLLGLLFSNGMLLLTVAALAPLTTSWLWALPLYALLLLLFAPPRLVYWTKRPFSLLSLIVFDVLLTAATAAIIVF